MKPYYEHNGITIYCGDCRELLPDLQGDLLLTDPPYGIGDRMQGGTWGSAGKYADFRAWDAKPEEQTITALLACAPSQAIWGGNYFPLPPSRCWLVWDKQNAVPTMADCELAWTNLDRPVKRFSSPVGVHRHGHPTEKPLGLMLWCLSMFPEANSVLDPFMGSGTTLRAAKDLGKSAVGIDIDERYCEIAAKRLAQEVLSL